MMQNFFQWLSKLVPGKSKDTPPGPVGVRVRPPAQREGVRQPAATAKHRPAAQPRKPDLRFDSELGGHIEDNGPGKNVLVRSKYLREDTGTHEALKIIDESLVVEDEDAGIDPYNTGRFDRSQTWNSRFRK